MMIMAAIFGLIAIVLFGSSSFWVNLWWYQSMGYRDVLVTRYIAQAVAFTLAFLACGGFLFANMAIALRRSRGTRPVGTPRSFTDRFLFWLLLLASLFIGFLAGIANAGRWDMWLLWWNRSPFGVKDPTFNRDIGFYIFSLPVLNYLRNVSLLILFATVAGVIFIYTVRLGVNLSDIRSIPGRMRVHVVVLGGILMVVLGLGYIVANYELVYSSRGVVYGASYVDVHVQRIGNLLLAAVSVVAAAILVMNAFNNRVKLLVIVVGVWVGANLLVGAALPSVIQRTIVEPNELSREREYIENNVGMTQLAFGLENVTERVLTGQGITTAADLEANPETVDNIRMWDYRVVRSTNQQLQSFVPYYVFLDVDVDRYIVDGQIQQVVVSARELDPNGLPTSAQTWTNQRLVYTHGYGMTISPVSQVSRQGLPAYTVGNIPPNGTGPYEITQPEIYYGESSSNWVIVNTKASEFSGLDPLNEGTGYAGAGKGSIQLDDVLTKAIVAINLGDRNIFISGQIQSESRLLLRRNIVERIESIAPFLTLDQDPYIVIDNGKLYWIVDAYTTSSRFPGATPIIGINYARNSVKVVVDAYDGTTTFYRTSEADPIADAYAEMFPGMFQPISAVSPGIAAHFRYPELLFDIQTEVFATFHVEDPNAFYNGEDRWAVAQEQLGNRVGRMEPYYVTMTLPQETEPDFPLIRPFTPGGQSTRQNMTAWMAGRADETGKLDLVVYRFPRQTTVFGPRQIEARIDQEPEISAQITLWSQSGSTVIRGNLIVIPINESVLYIQPLYLQATGTEGALPELKRVIVASNERVVMYSNLGDALEAIVAADPEDVVAVEPDTDIGTPTVVATDPKELAEQALIYYQEGEDALARGDWTAYGEAQRKLQDVLEKLAGEAPPADATPVPTE